MDLNENQRGKFIVLEYVDGGSARPFIDLIVEEYFSDAPDQIETTKEPTDGLFSGPLRFALSRDSILDKTHRQTLIHAFLADRVDHIEREQGIRDFLNQGKTVVCDRFNLSTYAYQLESEDDFEWFYICSKHLLVPDLTIFLKYDIDDCVEIAHKIRPTSVNANEFSLLNNKTRHDKDELRPAILRTESKYLKAIEFLQKKNHSHNYKIIDVKNIPTGWFRLSPIISECLQRSPS
jgi:thymidylate kinase